MDDMPKRAALLHRLAWACAVLVLAVTSLSAFLRLTKAGVGCQPWPQCQVQQAQPGAAIAAAPNSAVFASARMAHRMAASAALVLIVAMLLLARARRLRGAPAGLIWGLLVLALFLAALGRLAGASSAPAVTLANLLGGMAMFGLAARLVCVTGERQRAGLQWAWALAALALLLVQLVLGGLVSAAYLAARCDASLLCQAHGGAGLLTASVLGVAGMFAWRQRPRLMVALWLLALSQVVLGVAMLSQAMPLPLALAHNVVAVLLMGVLAALP
jgi:cytochrome c oxidase assembly protein subunit 15